MLGWLLADSRSAVLAGEAAGTLDQWSLELLADLDERGAHDSPAPGTA